MNKQSIPIEIGVPFRCNFSVSKHPQTRVAFGYRDYGLSLFKSNLCFLSIRLVRLIIPHHNNNTIHPLVMHGETIFFGGEVNGISGNVPAIRAYLPYSLMIRMKQIAGTNLNHYLSLGLYMKADDQIYQWINDKDYSIRPQYRDMSRCRAKPGLRKGSVPFWPTDNMDTLNQTEFLLCSREVTDEEIPTLFR